MKKLILIIGPNGVGKTTTAKILLQKLSKCAYVDADWCRAINPFPFTDAAKYAVSQNIYSLFKNYLLCEDIEYIIFPYGFHGNLHPEDAELCALKKRIKDLEEENEVTAK